MTAQSPTGEDTNSFTVRRNERPHGLIWRYLNAMVSRAESGERRGKPLAGPPRTCSAAAAGPRSSSLGRSS